MVSIGFSDIRNDAIWASGTRFGDEATYLLPVRCENVRGNQGTDYVVSEAVEPWNQFRTISSACWYRHADFRRLWPEYTDLRVEDVETKLYNELGWEPSPSAKPFQKITPVLIFAFLPPLISLIGGGLIVWAVAGFRPSQK